MDSYDVSRDVTDHTATDVGNDLTVPYGHHGDRGCGGQPVGLVIAAGIVAHVVKVAEDKRHGAEALQAGARPAWGPHETYSLRQTYHRAFTQDL